VSRHYVEFMNSNHFINSKILFIIPLADLLAIFFHYFLKILLKLQFFQTVKIFWISSIAMINYLTHQ